MNSSFLIKSFGFLFGAISLFLISQPSSAKQIWLKCGIYEFNLDDHRERYSLELKNKLFQGAAVFNPNQINLSVPLVTYSDNPGGFRYDFAIDRKTLLYTFTPMLRVVFPPYSDTGWKLSGEVENGKCEFIKSPPTKGNQI